MQIISALWYFQRRLVLPAFLLSFLLSFFMMGWSRVMAGTGLGMLLLMPTAHLLVYDWTYKNEYLFYHNMGLSRRLLWLSTLLVGMVMAAIFFAL
ncbi:MULTISPECIES: hypothetical protein [Pedobacter]|uniref:hypothetical protein n=1 Tax=Pedobacter TaxID=84567 RepID=UPI0021090D85|nr:MULTISPECIES: hypothetical protein [unclassified Pedobacter]